MAYQIGSISSRRMEVIVPLYLVLKLPLLNIIYCSGVGNPRQMLIHWVQKSHKNDEKITKYICMVKASKSLIYLIYIKEDVQG